MTEDISAWIRRMAGRVPSGGSGKRFDRETSAAIQAHFGAAGVPVPDDLAAELYRPPDFGGGPRGVPIATTPDMNGAIRALAKRGLSDA